MALRCPTEMLNRYKASMILSGVCDALGYKNGDWELSCSGPNIHKELQSLGGLATLSISAPGWIVSDDTVMHLATAEALTEIGSDSKEGLYALLAAKYKESMNDMVGRAAGLTCISSCHLLKPNIPRGYQIPFNKSGGGCGAAMRAMCIGLRYPNVSDLDKLIAVSIESGRMTHNCPTGYLGALASALFTHYAIQRKPVNSWGAGLISVLPRAWSYIESQGRDVEENRTTWSYFVTRWTNYLKLRGIQDGISEPTGFDASFDVEARDEFYKSLSYHGWGGASGHDAPMIAYDALLGAGSSWEEFVYRGVLHGGDNDSTGAIAGACFGAMYGFNGVPLCNYENLEYRERLESLAEKLLERTLKT